MEFISLGLIVGGLSAFSAAVFVTSREGTAKTTSIAKTIASLHAPSSSPTQEASDGLDVKVQPSSPVISQTASELPRALEPTTPSTEKAEHAQLPGSSQFVPELDALLATHIQTGSVAAPSWWREQIQQLTEEIHTLQHQANTVERHIAILQTMAYCLTQLEDLKNEPSLNKHSASLVAQQHPVPFDTHRLEFLHPTEKRPALRKYTIKAL